MVILTRKLGMGEINWRGIVVPRAKKEQFPPPGQSFDLSDGTIKYKVKLDKQCRIRLTEWFKNHPEVKLGDEVAFVKQDGDMQVTLVKPRTSKTISLKDLLGRDTSQGKIIDIQQTPKGPVAVVQSTTEVALDKILSEL